MFKINIGINILAVIVAVTVLLNISVFELEFGYTYYGILILSFIILLVTGKRPHINFWFIILICAALISILFNDIPYFFRPYERLVAFIFVAALTGPFLRTRQLHLFKWQLLKSINFLIVILTLISFVGLILNSPLVYLGRGGFTGFFNHSMMMGPMAAISMLNCIHWGSNSIKKKWWTLYYILAVISFVTCVSAGSRAALLAGVLASLYFYYVKYQSNLKRYLKIILISISIGVLAFPLWEEYTVSIIGKMEYAEERGDIAVTRTHLWKRRLAEINSSPIFGIGFSNDSSKSIKDLYISEGQIEPGSSWLVVLAMTGLLGFIPFSILIISSFYFTYKNKNYHSDLPYLSSLIVFFAIHMLAEGYILSAGSGLFFYMWLLLGVTFIFQKGSYINKPLNSNIN